MRKKRNEPKSIVPTVCPACNAVLTLEKEMQVFDIDTEVMVQREGTHCVECNVDYFIEDNSLARQYRFFFGMQTPNWSKVVSDQDVAMSRKNEMIPQSN